MTPPEAGISDHVADDGLACGALIQSRTRLQRGLGRVGPEVCIHVGLDNEGRNRGVPEIPDNLFSDGAHYLHRMFQLKFRSPLFLVVRFISYVDVMKDITGFRRVNALFVRVPRQSLALREVFVKSLHID
ncbi:hypothetical protein [Pandoraea iniqua]|uniref:hypothetical protein n=1 Tax=Pandoraea iniqua TaxID=2508288 RepID=UPI001242764A|nr:hypothetical protein [Pandoraea iniqua]